MYLLFFRARLHNHRCRSSFSLKLNLTVVRPQISSLKIWPNHLSCIGVCLLANGYEVMVLLIYKLCGTKARWMGAGRNRPSFDINHVNKFVIRHVLWLDNCIWFKHCQMAYIVAGIISLGILLMYADIIAKDLYWLCLVNYVLCAKRNLLLSSFF